MGRPPPSFHGHLGQRQAVRIVRKHIRGSKVLELPCDPMLLTGPSGLGKTSLARAIAAECGGSLQEFVADARSQDFHLDEALDHLPPGDSLLIDEVQELGSETQMRLCKWIDDQQTHWAKDPHEKSDASARRGNLIAATDRPGRLLRPLFKRFPLVIPLQPYAPLEMTWIARKRVAERHLLLTNQAITQLAETCRGIPRLCGQRLGLLQRYWAEKGVVEMKSGHVRRFLSTHGIDALGLDVTDLQYLKALATAGESGATLKTLTKALDTDAEFLDRFVEPYLVRLGFVQIGSLRALAPAGRAYLEQLT